MGRSKTKLELIENEYARKVTFRKRKACLLKKINELTTLCGVVACAAIFSAYNHEPDVWPSKSAAIDAFEKFKTLPAGKKGKNMMDQEKFIHGRVSKLKDQLKKEKRKNHNLAKELILADCTSGLTPPALNCFENPNDLANLLDDCLQFVDEKIEQVEQSQA